ncbi:hypothetical protein MMC13_004169 [Lambiella insularis]|nr:hypothetical protein [Lambiella insularis]
MVEADGSEDVSDFLQRIRELGDKRDREDEERTRKLEEEILQGRKERQARRAERARSISPIKDASSNSGTPTSVRSLADLQTPQRPVQVSMDSSRSSASPPTDQGEGGKGRSGGQHFQERVIDNRGDSLRELPVQSIPQPSASELTPTTATSLSRAGTLSWQQRPSSRGSTGIKSRPLSAIAAENSAQHSPKNAPEPHFAEDTELSRDLIAQSLGSKDPLWFRQTADRGLGSAAFRKSPSDTMSHPSSGGGSMRLPGLARDSIAEPEQTTAPQSESTRSSAFYRDDSTHHSTVRSQGYSNAGSLSSAEKISSPLPTLSSHRLEPTAKVSSSQLEEFLISAKARSPGPASPDRANRPASPTKGLGGFVQSAMLKRADSMNKRSSLQALSGLSRENSVASNRGFIDGTNVGTSSTLFSRDFRASGASRETSPLASSRPGSSHNEGTLNPGEDVTQTSVDDGIENMDTREFIKPAIPESRRPTRDSSKEKDASVSETMSKSVPPSPTGSMTSMKKWSPTKASWLETALSKSESPKMKPAPLQQPSWMADINKAKELRGSVNLGKSTSFKEVATGGLLRSPALGAPLKSPSLNQFSATSPNPSISQTDDSPLASKPKGIDSQHSTEIAATKTNINKYVEVSTEDLVKTNPRLQPSDSGTSYTSQALVEANSSNTNEAASLSPPSTKSKPITPPKKDFRSTLKPRQTAKETEKDNEPEFKNVFGKLKRAETKNYVAPDELKSNIMRGKAGLSVSGGPQKSERRDELMESILKKKEEMKAGGPPGASRKASDSHVIQKPESPIPEALARRRVLGRSGSSQKVSIPEVKEEVSGGMVVQDSSQLSKFESPEKKTSAPARLQKDAASSGALGDRFIPALAGLLSRGPSPISAGSKDIKIMGPTNFTQDPITFVATNSHQSVDGPQLTHATKARARGPKRRLPTALEAAGQTSTKSIDQSQISAPSPTIEPIAEKVEKLAKPIPMPLASITNNIDKSQIQAPSRPDTFSQSSAQMAPKKNFDDPQKEVLSSVSKPPVPAKSSLSAPHEPLLPKASGSAGRRSPIESPSKLADSQIVGTHPTQGASDDVTIPTMDTSVSVLGAAARWGAPSDHQPQRARSPIKLPTRKDEEAAKEQAGFEIRKAQDPIGLGIDTTPVKTQGSRTIRHNLPSPPLIRSPKSPPLPAKIPALIAGRVVSNGTSATTERTTSSPVSRTSEAARLFSDFFDDAPTSNFVIDIDTQAVMKSRYSAEQGGKIKTLRKQIWEVTDDGKKLPVPSQQEHILFEGRMYLCSHVFGSPSGKRTTEVYLWCGDGVLASAVEDAQLFCRNMAKEAGGKLIILHQGKESSNFFEALGGIVITRRGPASRSGSSSAGSAMYMLCGRRHMGHIAFDEVDFSQGSLCSGFPYIVSATSGRLYLWKGKGSGADELGCARLIGMDLGLTGEIDEIDEGKEPASFWSAFSNTQSGSEHRVESTHWHLKPGCDKFATRLFSVELENRPKSSSSGYMNMWARRNSAAAVEEGTSTTIKEITPYAQRDLAERGVFVLDGFFEIWVIVGSQASSKLSTFRTALSFAQEYGILAASMEDRPFVPVGHVVLDGAPTGMKRAFRKWENDQRAGGREVVVPLNAALEAVRG